MNNRNITQKIHDALADTPAFFLRGIIIYTGPSALPLGERLIALPVNALWTTCL